MVAKRTSALARVREYWSFAFALSISPARARAVSHSRARAISLSGISLAIARIPLPPSSYSAVSPAPSESLPHPFFFFPPFAVPSFQRQPSTSREGKGKQRVPTNLHRVDLLAKLKIWMRIEGAPSFGQDNANDHLVPTYYYWAK